MGERLTYGILARYRVVLLERLGGLFFAGRRSCTEDNPGLYCGDHLTVSIISCLCVILGRRALNGSVLLLVLNSLTSSHSTSPQHEESLSGSIELFSPTPSITQNKWPSPLPLPQRSPRIRRRHNLHNYASLASTNGSYDVRSSVGAPPPDTPTAKYTTFGKLIHLCIYSIQNWVDNSQIKFMLL